MSECDDSAADAAEAALDAAISGPRRVRGDAGEVEQHGLKDLIEADKYRRSKCAGRRPGLGLRFVQLKPPGSA